MTPDSNRLGRDNCKTRRESFKFWDKVRLILEILRYVEIFCNVYRRFLPSSLGIIFRAHIDLILLMVPIHYSDVIMGSIASQIASLTIVYSSVYSGIDQRKHQSSASLAFVRGGHRRPVNSLHKGPVTRKMFPFDDVIMCIFVNQIIASYQIIFL